MKAYRRYTAAAQSLTVHSMILIRSWPTSRPTQSERFCNWVPGNGDDMHPNQQVATICDDLAQMLDRIERLRRGDGLLAGSKVPFARANSNIEIEEAENGEAVLYSNFI